MIYVGSVSNPDPLQRAWIRIKRPDIVYCNTIKEVPEFLQAMPQSQVTIRRFKTPHSYPRKDKVDPKRFMIFTYCRRNPLRFALIINKKEARWMITPAAAWLTGRHGPPWCRAWSCSPPLSPPLSPLPLLYDCFEWLA